MSHSKADTELSTLLKEHIRDIPDFPEPGIMFRDITTLLADPAMFRLVIDELIRPYGDTRIDKVVVIESRGFIFGTPIAYQLHAGVVPVRKPGKLPGETYSEQYELEYGTNTLEIHRDAIHDHERVIIVDDLLATGGTVEATIRLVERFGGEIVGISVLAELLDLKGRDRLGSYPVHSLVTY
jgi:adenine phosphoribosyltransferase